MGFGFQGSGFVGFGCWDVLGVCLFKFFAGFYRGPKLVPGRFFGGILKALLAFLADEIPGSAPTNKEAPNRASHPNKAPNPN